MSKHGPLGVGKGVAVAIGIAVGVWVGTVVATGVNAGGLTTGTFAQSPLEITTLVATHPLTLLKAIL